MDIDKYIFQLYNIINDKNIDQTVYFKIIEGVYDEIIKRCH